MAEGSITSSEVVRIENHGVVRVISMNRPDKLNALNTALLVALRDALPQRIRMTVFAPSY